MAWSSENCRGKSIYIRMKKFTFIFIIMYISDVISIKFTPLKKTNIFIDTLGPVHLYSSELKLVIAVNPEETLISSKNATGLIKKMENSCKKFHCEIESDFFWATESRTKRLNDSITKFESLTHLRNKRDLLNVTGKISKTLFGTLDNDDFNLINENLDKLFVADNETVNIIRNQTVMIGTRLNTTTIQILKLFQKEDAKLFSEAKDLLHFIVQIIVVEALTAELTENLEILNTAILLGRNGIIHSGLIQRETFLTALNNLKESTHSYSAIDFNAANFQTILSISRIAILVHSRKIIYHIAVPLIEDTEWTLKKLYPIPYKQQDIFVSIIIDHDIVLEAKSEYILLDFEYLETKCRTYDHYKLCQRTRPNHLNTQSDCFPELIHKKRTKEKCGIAVFKILDITYIPLGDTNRYIIVPEKPTEMTVICDNRTTVKISEPQLLVSTKDCILITETTRMKISGDSKEYAYETLFRNITLEYTPLDLNIFHESVPRTPVITSDFSLYQIDLKEMDQKISNLSNQKRIKTWIEIGLTILEILGYAALALVTIYTAYKLGLFNCLKGLRNTSINKCCPMVTASHNIQQLHPTAAAPIQLYS